jgi:hypothetical protein
MSPDEKCSDDDTWFVYSRSAVKITATPVNGKGWSAFVACVAFTIFVGIAVSRWAFTFHPLLAGLALAAVIVIGVLLIIRLVIAKGRLA